MAFDLLSKLSTRIFYFGEYASHFYGCVVFRVDGTVRASYDHPREAFCRLEEDQLLFLASDARSVTSKLALVREGPLLFHGSSIGLNNRLYLVEAMAFAESPSPVQTSASAPTVLVTTVPKSGTYFLQKVWIDFGLTPTDLHFGSREVYDNRGLPRDTEIHSNPWKRRIELSVPLLRPFLPSGSISVGHVESLEILLDLMDQGVVIFPVVRDLRSIVWSLYRFKLAVVEPTDSEDAHWRSRESEVERFMGFFIYHLRHDLLHIASCFRAFSQLPGIPVFRYEDLLDGVLSDAGQHYLKARLRDCGGLERFQDALYTARYASTPTLSAAYADAPTVDPEQAGTIRALIDAAVQGSSLAELNALFGYR